MPCIVCATEHTTTENDVCGTCLDHITRHFSDSRFAADLVAGCRRASRAHVTVAREVVKIMAARSQLAAFYFSRPESEREHFLWRYNCRTAHQELHDILGPVSAREVIKWRGRKSADGAAS